MLKRRVVAAVIIFLGYLEWRSIRSSVKPVGLENKRLEELKQNDPILVAHVASLIEHPEKVVCPDLRT